MSISFYPEPVPGEVAIARRKYGEYYQLGIWPYYPDIPLFQVLKTTATLDPEKLVILHPKKMTMKELDDLTDKLATALTDLGAKKGRTISLYMWNSPEFVTAFFGILKTGATVTALDPSFKEKDAQCQLDDSESIMVIVDEEQYHVIENIREKLPMLENVIVVGEKRQLDSYLFKELIEKYPPNPPRVKTNPKKGLSGSSVHSWHNRPSKGLHAHALQHSEQHVPVSP